MITFATLFLGLVVGGHPVEVAVGDEVARVEIVLDGVRVGTLDAAPWKLDVDFGPELAPRRLEAVAYDADGFEAGRAQQLVNLPRPPAQVSVLVAKDPGSETSTARLSWESTVGERPLSVTAWFDGRPLVVNDPHNIALPPFDDAQLHLFSADLEFADNVISQVMATFGGEFGEQVHSELTALPVLLAGGSAEAPPIDALRGWFLRDGEPVDVVSIERGWSEVVIVLGTTLSYGGGRPAWSSRSGRSKERIDEKTAVPLQGNQIVRFLNPEARASRGVETVFNLYPMSPEFRRTRGGLYWLLTRLSLRGAEGGTRRLADAVAVAGLAAYERHRRRAVVLLAGSEIEDESLVTGRQARRYLERLKVPFFLWARNKNVGEIPGWGKPVEISSLEALRRAFRDVNENLSRQWIVWLDGIHLPDEIELSSAARGVELLSAP